MMRALIGGLLHQRLIIFLAMGVVLFLGLMTAPFDWDLGVERAPVPVDAIPDISEAQHIVATDWPGRSPQDVEDQITYPLTVQLMGMPGVKTTRSTSMFGLSMVNVILDEGVDFYWARSRILEKLASLPRGTLPDDVAPALGPDATPLGQVYWYTLEGRTPDGHPTGGWTLEERRTAQDFLVKPALQSARGISEIASVGGYQKEYQVDIDPDALRYHGVALDDVVRAIKRSNRDVGASTIEINRVEYVVRGLGAIRSLEALRAVVVRAQDGVPLTLEQVAEVRFGPALRRGALDKDGAEAVGGVAVVRYGDNPMAAIKALNEQIAAIADGLPSKTLADGTTSRLTVVPFYDRTGLIDETLETLETALVDQVLITILIVVLMMLNLRASAVVGLLLPVAVLMTFVLMKAAAVDANVVALAGIAIAIGTMVDVGIVVVENVIEHLREAPPDAPRLDVIRDAVTEVAGAVLTAMATTIVSFLPVFGLTAAEGKLFSPLAWTKTLALAAAAFIAIVVLPSLVAALFPRRLDARLQEVPRWTRWVVSGVVALVCGWLLAGHWMPLGQAESTGTQFAFVVLVVGGFLALIMVFRHFYERLLRLFLRHRWLFMTLPAAIIFFGVTAWLGADTTLGWLPDSATQGARARMPGLEEGYLPDLDEGDFLYMPSTMPHASLGATLEAMQEVDRRIAALPEVKHAVGKLGRADSALDPAPLSMIETVVTVKPEWSEGPDGERVRNWRPSIRTRDDLWAAIAEAGAVPEMAPGPRLQPIRTRIVMLQSGMKGELGIKIQGPDLDAAQTFGAEVERVLKGVPQVATPLLDRTVGKPYLEIVPDRAAIARYGLDIERVQQALEVAIGGAPLSRTIEGRSSFAIRVRYPHERRLSPDTIGQLMLAVPGRADQQIPLSMVAEIHMTTGPMAIKSEDTFKVAYVSFGKGEDASTGQRYGLTEAVLAAEGAVRDALAGGDITVPAGVRWEMAGDWKNKERAAKSLALLLPLALVIIVILLQLQFRSFTVTLMVFSGVAVAMGGGFLMVWAWGQPGFLDVELFGHNMRDVFHVAPVEMTVAVWVGFIALIGIATDDGVVMATYLKQRFERDPPATRAEVVEAVVDAGRRRITPCLMTTATTVLALLPVLASSGKGADVMIPMAIPAFGGMLFELVTLFVVPILYATWQDARLARARVFPSATPRSASCS